MKTSVYIGTSLDGFIAKKDDDIEWLVKFQNEEVHLSYKEFISAIDAIVIGRGTYEKVLMFPAWPYEQKVFVLSTTIKELPGAVKEKATLLSMKPKQLLAQLFALGLQHLYIDGGKVIQQFLQEDCIDEMIITRVPVLIGSGISLFGDLAADLSFRHIQTSVYTNGLVKSHYKRNRE